MARNSIFIVGAGREGKGFLGETFTAGGWQVHFLDKDPRVIDALNGGNYNVTLYKADGTFHHKVTGYKAYLTDDCYSCLAALTDTDLIALAIYPEDIPEAGEYLSACLAKRAQTAPDKKLTILSCTNKNHIIDWVEENFTKHLDADTRQWFRDNVAVRDVIVRRSTDAETNYSLEIVTGVVATLLIQSPIYADLSELEWMELYDGVEQLKDIKLCTYNAPHAAKAYAGYIKGYKTINQAAADPEISHLASEVLKEAVACLSLEYSMPEEEIWKFCTLPKTAEPMDDSISRVAVDPIRKLGRYDRLTGNAMLCVKYGIDPKALITAIANGMAYDEPSDKNARLIQKYIRDLGIVKATAKVCGLPENHEIVLRVSKHYDTI